MILEWKVLSGKCYEETVVSRMVFVPQIPHLLREIGRKQVVRRSLCLFYCFHVQQELYGNLMAPDPHTAAHYFLLLSNPLMKC